MSNYSGYYILRNDLTSIGQMISDQSENWLSELKMLEGNLKLLTMTDKYRGKAADSIRAFVEDGPVAAVAALKAAIIVFGNLAERYVKGYASVDSDEQASLHEGTITDLIAALKQDEACFMENRDAVMRVIDSVSDIFVSPISPDDISYDISSVREHGVELNESVRAYEAMHSEDTTAVDAQLSQLNVFFEKLAGMKYTDISSYTHRGLLTDGFSEMKASVDILEKLYSEEISEEDIKEFGEVNFSELLNRYYGPMLLAGLKYGDKVEIPIGPGIVLFAGISGKTKGLSGAQIDIAVDKNTESISLGGGNSIDIPGGRSFGISGDKNADLNMSIGTDGFEYDLSSSGEGCIVLKKEVDDDTTLTITFKTDGKVMEFEEKAQTKVEDGKIDTKIGVKISKSDKGEEAETVMVTVPEIVDVPAPGLGLQILHDLIMELVPALNDLESSIHEFFAAVPILGGDEYFDISYITIPGQGSFAFGF